MGNLHLRRGLAGESAGQVARLVKAPASSRSDTRKTSQFKEGREDGKQRAVS